jgi:hypothetical protein
MEFDITVYATWIPLLAGVVIPFVVALLAKQNASGWVKSAIAALSAALVALATYLADVSGAHSWKGAASVFVLALISAAASRVTITGGADAKLAEKIPGGVG